MTTVVSCQCAHTCSITPMESYHQPTLSLPPAHTCTITNIITTTYSYIYRHTHTITITHLHSCNYHHHLPSSQSPSPFCTHTIIHSHIINTITIIHPLFHHHTFTITNIYSLMITIACSHHIITIVCAHLHNPTYLHSQSPSPTHHQSMLCIITTTITNPHLCNHTHIIAITSH
jgi:hypothetical protein